MIILAIMCVVLSWGHRIVSCQYHCESLPQVGLSFVAQSETDGVRPPSGSSSFDSGFRSWASGSFLLSPKCYRFKRESLGTAGGVLEADAEFMATCGRSSRQGD